MKKAGKKPAQNHYEPAAKSRTSKRPARQLMPESEGRQLSGSRGTSLPKGKF